jgi:hypothetical protein
MPAIRVKQRTAHSKQHPDTKRVTKEMVRSPNNAAHISLAVAGGTRRIPGTYNTHIQKIKLMKESILYRFLLPVLAALGLAFTGNAQSATTITGSQDLGGQTEYAQYLYIGPGAVISIPAGQDWIISSQYVFIAPGAQILGPGRMILDNPAKFGPVPEAAAWAGQPTTIDGGNAQIMAPVVVRNPNNVVLGSVPIAASGGDITTANTDHTLYIGTNLDFATTNGDGTAISSNDVVLGANDLKIAPTATITHYDPNSFVVTNGTGHLYKMPYTGTFVYPVGITDGDYTPASVSATANGVHVNVNTYAAAPSGSISAPGEGIDRLWNIYGDNTSGGNICLQHNTATNGALYNDAQTFVTQYVGTMPNSSGDAVSESLWQSNTQGAGVTGTMTDPAGTVAGSSTRCRNYASLPTSATANSAWFTKSSEPISPLPVVLEYFRATAVGCDAELSWKTATEAGFDHFDILRSFNGSKFERIASVPGSNNASGHVYTYTARQEASSAYYRLKMVDIDGSERLGTDIQPVRNNCNSAGESFVVYPNPASGSAAVQVKYETGTAKGKGRLWVCDIAGRVFYSTAVQVEAGTNQYTIPAGTMASGTYIVKLVSDNGSWDLSPVKLTLTGTGTR